MFDKFWNLVAHKQAKPQCEIKFNRAAKTIDPETIIKAYEGQLTAHQVKERMMNTLRRPLTWLNQKGWLDPFEAKDIADTRASRAKGRIRNWQKTGFWHDNWGFPPDHPGALQEIKEALREMQHGEKKAKQRSLTTRTCCQHPKGDSTTRSKRLKQGKRGKLVRRRRDGTSLDYYRRTARSRRSNMTQVCPYALWRQAGLEQGITSPPVGHACWVR